MKKLTRRGKRIDNRDKSRKVMSIIVLVLLCLTLSASFAEAKAMDSVKGAWQKMRVYALSAPFWVNGILIFAVAILLYSLIADKSDNTQKVMIYILIGVIALIVSSKIVASNNVPQYIWKVDQFHKFTQFIIGPPAGQGPGACGATAQTFLDTIFRFGKSAVGIEPVHPCCGDGAYFAQLKGKQVCKQAILRTNEDGSGLPAFIIALILFYLLFNGYKDKLGISGDKAGKWMPILLSVVLAGLLTNQRLTKNNLIMIGGWVAVALIGSKLNESLGKDDKDAKGSKRGYAFGLAFAFVQLIANMLGTSLFGTNVDASDITFANVIWNFAIGLLVGMIYGIFAGEGILGQVLDGRRQKKKEEIAKLVADGKGWQAIKRSLPFIGGRFAPKDPAKKAKESVEKIVGELNRVKELYPLAKEPDTITALDETVKKLEQKLASEVRKSI